MSIMSCGELKDVKFTINKNNIPDDRSFPGVDKDREFEGLVVKKNNKDTKSDIESEPGKKRDIKVAQGAKIIKIQNESDIRNLAREYGENLSRKGRFAKSRFMSNLKKDYDGIYIDDSIRGRVVDEVFGKERGLTILNSQVVYLEGSSKIVSCGSGLSSNLNKLSESGKKIDNKAYEKASGIIESRGDRYMRFQFPDYDKYEGFNMNEVGDVKKYVMDSKIKGDQVGVSRYEVAVLLAAFEGVWEKKLEVGLAIELAVKYKNVSREQYEGGWKKDKLADLKSEIIRKHNGNWVVSKDSVFKYAKEELHMEKKAWDNIIQEAKSEGRDMTQVEEIAIASIAKKTTDYLELKASSEGRIVIGGRLCYYE